jgi:hypothetical protein
MVCAIRAFLGFGSCTFNLNAQRLRTKNQRNLRLTCMRKVMVPSGIIAVKRGEGSSWMTRQNRRDVQINAGVADPVRATGFSALDG